MDKVNALDLGFIVDTTGSMGAFISLAQRQMIDIIDQLSRASDVDLRLAVVEYRDHPPQDQMLTRVHKFTSNLSRAQKTIKKLQANGGGDGPEAVFDGIVTACQQLEWRTGSRRVAVLVGDAPPHGIGAGGDGFPKGCPCGQTMDSVTTLAEEVRVTLFALGLTGAVRASFGQLSQFTGGEYFETGQGKDAIEHLKQILVAEFGNLAFDRRVYSAWNEGVQTINALAEKLDSSRPDVSMAISRLGGRGLLA